MGKSYLKQKHSLYLSLAALLTCSKKKEKKNHRSAQGPRGETKSDDAALIMLQIAHIKAVFFFLMVRCGRSVGERQNSGRFPSS